jgi:YD repeat-containing protein
MNLTTVQYMTQGSSTISKTFTYYDTGMLKTATDVNGSASTVTYVYPDATTTCGNAFPTSINEPLSLSRSTTWYCAGGVQLTATDENGKATTTAYTNDPFYWRPDSVTDPANAVTSFCYGLMSNSTGTCTRNSTQVESVLNFNSNNSAVDSLTSIDTLGRAHVTQVRQSPSLTTFDSTETDYDSLGRPNRSTLPYSGNQGQTNSTAPAVATTYDALGRALTVTDAGGGTVNYTYQPNSNDVLIVGGPAPTGENTKQRQLESDGLGRLTSVCIGNNQLALWLLRTNDCCDWVSNEIHLRRAGKFIDRHAERPVLHQPANAQLCLRRSEPVDIRNKRRVRHHQLRL